MLHRVKELHYIMPINNIPSMLIHGILSRVNLRERLLQHDDISMDEIQKRRKDKLVPNGKYLHEYVNLYFDARNSMMFKRKDLAEKICVLCISIEALNLQGVVVTDQNIASDWVRFLPPQELESLNFDRIYAKYCVECQYIKKAYVIDENVKEDLICHGFDENKIEVNSELFFR